MSSRDDKIREIMKEMEPYVEALRSKSWMIKGIALGLFYGIIGNMLVSHYYQIFQGIVIWQLDTMFWTNLAVFVIILVVIVIVSWRWLISMAKIQGALEAFERVKEIMRE